MVLVSPLFLEQLLLAAPMWYALVTLRLTLPIILMISTCKNITPRTLRTVLELLMLILSKINQTWYGSVSEVCVVNAAGFDKTTDCSQY